MTLFSNPEKIVVAFTHHGVQSFAEPGDSITVEFPDGKGVGGRLAGVDIAAGGTPFSLIVTHDGDVPPPETTADDYDYTTEIGGETFTRRQWEAVQAYMRGPEMARDAVSPDRGEVTLERDPRELTGELTRTRFELELSRERAQEALARWHASANRVEGLIEGLSKARAERDEAIYRADQLEAELRSLHEHGRTIIVNVHASDTLTNEAGE